MRLAVDLIALLPTQAGTSRCEAWRDGEELGGRPAAFTAVCRLNGSCQDLLVPSFPSSEEESHNGGGAGGGEEVGRGFPGVNNGRWARRAAVCIMADL